MSDQTPEFVACARCWRPTELRMHEGIEWKPFTHPIQDDSGIVWTHFALCPENGEPILMRKEPK